MAKATYFCSGARRLMCLHVQARSGAAQVQALKAARLRSAAAAITSRAADAAAAAEGGGAMDDDDNVLTHWVRSAADMRLKARALRPVLPPLLCHWWRPSSQCMLGQPLRPGFPALAAPQAMAEQSECMVGQPLLWVAGLAMGLSGSGGILAGCILRCRTNDRADCCRLRNAHAFGTQEAKSAQWR